MTSKEVRRYFALIGAKGGKTKGPSKARKSEAMRAAALKRWNRVPKS